ncbi:MAG TPA: hypothetical protein VIV15_04600 [Anaerolineales bacterium]
MKTQSVFSGLLRMLVTGTALALVLGALVALFGLISGWRNAIEFSNGMFVMGSAVVIFGLLSVWGGFTARGSFAITYAQSVSDMSILERGKLWMLDSLRGYNVVVVGTVCGLLLIGVSILVYQLFGIG